MRLKPDIADDPMPSPHYAIDHRAWQRRVLARQLHNAVSIARDLVYPNLIEQPTPDMWGPFPDTWSIKRHTTLGHIRTAVEHMEQAMKLLGVVEEEDERQTTTFPQEEIT